MDDALQTKAGFYRDSAGIWQKDRRSGVDRRAGKPAEPWVHERRGIFRRQVDRELYEKEHKQMIEEALTEFAEEHEGHV
jgi:hypothetical protein